MSHTYTSPTDTTEMDHSRTSCLTVAVVVVLHYLHFDVRLNNLFSFLFLNTVETFVKILCPFFPVVVNVYFLFYEL